MPDERVWQILGATASTAPEFESPALFDEREDRGEVDVERLGLYSEELIIRALLAKMAELCREGIHVDILEAPAATSSIDRDTTLLVIDSAANRRTVLGDDVKFWNEAWSAAHQEILKCQMDLKKSTSNAGKLKIERKLARYRRDEDDALDRLNKAETALGEALAISQIRDAPRKIVTLGTQVQNALSNLLTSDGRITQEHRQALDIVLIDFHFLTPRLGQVWVSAKFLLPIPGGGLAAFGPIECPIGAGGKGAGVVRHRRRRQASATRRHELLDQLRSYPELQANGDAVFKLLNSPFQELPYVVMHGLDQRTLPDWIGDQWRRPPFVAWVAHRYGTVELRRPKGRSMLLSRERQLLASLAAERGAFTERELLEFIGVPVPHFTKWYAKDQRSALDPNVIEWYAPVVRGPGRVGTFSNVICNCGQPAIVVAHSHEVPRDLLCSSCRGMPERARFGMPDDVEFPDEYFTFLLCSLEECVEDMRQRSMSTSWTPTELQMRTLDALQLMDRAVTASELAEALGFNAQRLHHELRTLWSRRRVIKLEGRPALWLPADCDERPTEEPRARATPSALTDEQRKAGPFVRAVDARRRLGITNRALETRRRRSEVLALPDGKFFAYPEWQFADEGGVHESLLPVIKALGGADPLAAALWLVSPHSTLGDTCPRDAALQGADIEAVIGLAVHEHGHPEPLPVGASPLDATRMTAGPFLRTTATREILGDISLKMIHGRRRRGEVLALKNGPWHLFPQWQFTGSGKVHNGISAILKALRDVEPWDVAMWLVSPHPAFNAASPRDVLLAGGEETRVVHQALVDQHSMASRLM